MDLFLQIFETVALLNGLNFPLKGLSNANINILPYTERSYLFPSIEDCNLSNAIRFHRIIYFLYSRAIISKRKNSILTRKESLKFRSFFKRHQ